MMGVVAPGASGPIASYGKRVAAMAVDWLLAVVVYGVFAVPAVLVQGGSTTSVSPAYLALMGAGALAALALGITQLWLEGSRGSTVGKRLLKIRVVDATTAQPYGFGRAFLRQLIKGILSVALPLLALSPLWDKSGRLRAWHDSIADTVVLDGLVGGTQQGPTTASFAPPQQPQMAGGRAASPVPEALPFAVPGIPTEPRAAGVGYGVGYAAAPSTAPVAAPAPAAPAAPRAVPAPQLPEYLQSSASHGGRPPHASELGSYRAAPTLPGHGVPAPPAPPAPTPAAPAPTAGPPARPVPASPPAPPAPPTPEPAHAPAAHDPRHAPQAHAQVQPAPAERPASGVITAVPGFGPPRATPASAAAPTYGAAPAYGSAPARPTERPHVAMPELDDDLDMTRLKPVQTQEASAPPAPEEVEAEIPPSALLRLSDGQEMTVTETVLIGRNPSTSDGETVGELFRVPDPGRSVSKTHLLVGVDDEGVWVVDRASTNGTIVTLSDGQQIICAAHQVVRLPDGAAVGFGDYSVTFEYRNS